MRNRSEIVSCNGRIKRGNDLPDFVSAEQHDNHRYPHRFEVGVGAQRVSAMYRRSRWSWIEGRPNGIKRRSVFCWIVHQREKIGALEFCDYVLDMSLDNSDMFSLLDGESSHESELGRVLRTSWRDVSFEVAAEGTIVVFQTAWVRPGAAAGIWACVAEELLQREFSRQALLMMKAFPLEYEGRAPTGSLAHQGLVRRQRAMLRYYRSLFGVTAIPNSLNAGWLYRAADGVPPPRVSSESGANIAGDFWARAGVKEGP